MDGVRSPVAPKMTSVRDASPASRPLRTVGGSLFAMRAAGRGVARLLELVALALGAVARALSPRGLLGFGARVPCGPFRLDLALRLHVVDRPRALAAGA